MIINYRAVIDVTTAKPIKSGVKIKTVHFNFDFEQEKKLRLSKTTKQAIIGSFYEIAKSSGKLTGEETDIQVSSLTIV